MKSLLRIVFCIIAGASFLIACNDSDDTVKGFTLSMEEVTLGAEGGTQVVDVTAGTKWVAKASEPWLQVLPANGVGSAECKILVDSTLRNDVRNATITFVPEGGTAQKVTVYQTGFKEMIGLSVTEVEVPNMENTYKRFFEVAVTTNIPFDIEIETDAVDKTWLPKPKIPAGENSNARPRTIKMRFNWTMNTNPMERLANVKFFPVRPEDQKAETVFLKVKQVAGPKIEDNRAGDSLALIIAQEKTNCMVKWDTSEKMEYWKGVTLWEKKDKEVKDDPKRLGRVRSAEIRMLSTEEGIPDEIAHLKYVEKLVFASNTNTMLIKGLSPGTAFCNLEYLKDLTIYAYGIESLPDEFVKLGKSLEVLNLSGNNFTAIPSMLKPTNFVKLRSLDFSSQRRFTVTDLKNDTRPDLGLKIMTTNAAFKTLLKWENLRRLRLSYNLIYGALPDMKYESGIQKYTEQEVAQNDTLKTAAKVLVGTPKVLPNCRDFSINLNFITGAIPDWMKNHPNLGLWSPFIMVFNQEKGYDMSGNVPGFNNEPSNLEYYYELYPLRKPKTTTD